MSVSHEQLLQATIDHLRGLKSRGVRYVAVSPETLQGLAARPVLNRVAKPQVAAAIPGERPAAPIISKPATVIVPSVASAPVVSAAPKPLVTPASPIVPTAVSSEAKVAAFANLRQRALVCVRCPNLASSRKSVVFGVGNIDAELMFVGEAPGADEDRQGEPFVGKAGQLLTKIIEAMGLSRQTVYIANILKCRPDTPGQSAGNRKPTPEEMQTCIPYLHEQIDLIRPKVLVALGGTAIEGLLGKTSGVMKARGNWSVYRGTPLMPTFHPAYLLRNQAPTEKRKVWEDMMQVMEKLGLPISEKQRGFFLKAAG